MEELEQGYLKIIQADEFVKNFKDLKEFEQWANDPLATKEDLSACIDVFESYELYEHCAILKKVYEQKP